MSRRGESGSERPETEDARSTNNTGSGGELLVGFQEGTNEERSCEKRRTGDKMTGGERVEVAIRATRLQPSPKLWALPRFLSSRPSRFQERQCFNFLRFHLGSKRQSVAD
jgi:hypothetical protein